MRNELTLASPEALWRKGGGRQLWLLPRRHLCALLQLMLASRDWREASWLWIRGAFHGPSFDQCTPPSLLDCPRSMDVACLKSAVIHMGRCDLCGFLWEGKHKIKKNIKLIDSSPQRSWLPEYCQHVPSTKLISIIVTPKKGYYQILLDSNP